MTDLKQMQFVDDISTRAARIAESTYSTVRERTPQFLDPTVKNVENIVQPYYAKVQDASCNLLKAVDCKVDTGVKSVGDAQTRVKEYTSSPRQRIQKVTKETSSIFTDTYSFVTERGVQGCIAFTKDKLSNASVEAQKSAVSTVSSVYQYTWDTAQSTWKSLHERPSTQPYARKATDLTYVAKDYYTKLHSTVVANSMYAKAYAVGGNCIQYFVTGNPYITNTATCLHSAVRPYVQHIADPAVEAATPLVQAVHEHLQPTKEAEKNAPSNSEVEQSMDATFKEVLQSDGHVPKKLE